MATITYSNYELEPWYSMDIHGKMEGKGIYGEPLADVTPKRYKVPVKHLQVTLSELPGRNRKIPSWENLNYVIFMCKYTNHFGHAVNLYATITKSRTPVSDDEELRLDLALQAAEELLEWEE